MSCTVRDISDSASDRPNSASAHIATYRTRSAVQIIHARVEHAERRSRCRREHGVDAVEPRRYNSPEDHGGYPSKEASLVMQVGWINALLHHRDSGQQRQ